MQKKWRVRWPLRPDRLVERLERSRFLVRFFGGIFVEIFGTPKSWVEMIQLFFLTKICCRWVASSTNWMCLDGVGKNDDFC